MAPRTGFNSRHVEQEMLPKANTALEPSVPRQAMQRIVIQIPSELKARLDEQRKRGITASGLIRYLLEQHFKEA